MQITLRPIIPKQPVFKLDRVAYELNAALTETMDDIEKDFRATTRTWSSPPPFRRHGPRLVGSALVGEVGTSDEIYGYVTGGTRPHIIVPRRSRLLRFRTGYRAKTAPRYIGSRAGGPFVTARVVHHPGTAAREFESEIADRRRIGFARRVQDGIKRAAR